MENQLGQLEMPMRIHVDGGESKGIVTVEFEDGSQEVFDAASEFGERYMAMAEEPPFKRTKVELPVWAPRL